MTQQQNLRPARGKNTAKVRPRKSPSRSAPVWKLGLPIKTRKTGKRLKKGVQVTAFEIEGGKAEVTRSLKTKKTRIKAIRNPWWPDNIVQLVKFLSVSYPASKAFVAVLKAWMQSRDAKEITIKAHGNELIIKGHMSQSRIKNILDEFGKRIDGSVHADIKVGIPKGVKRSVPRDLMTKRKESKK